jgi:hypothetical protein
MAEFNFQAALNQAFGEKEFAKKEHFMTIYSLMYAHANYVLVSHEDEDWKHGISLNESKIDSA